MVARFLFVVPPMAGHAAPAAAVASALGRRGHRVAWAAHTAEVGRWIPAGDEVFPLDASGDARARAWLAERGSSLTGLEATRFLWQEWLVPLARATLPAVETAVARFRPDVVVADQQALAGGLAARRATLPWATLATTTGGRPQTLAALPRVFAWSERLLDELQAEAGLEPVAEAENSPLLVLAFSTPALAGPGPWPPSWRFVGPALDRREDARGFPWERLGPPPRVLATLGTMRAERGARFLEALGLALSGAPLSVVLAGPADGRAFPENFLARPWVPQLALLGEVQAVVCHGGHNTVCEALAYGVPLVVAPIADDQPEVARQVVEAGAGLRVSFLRPRPAAIREAVERVIGERSFREAAERVRRSFAEAGGADAAAGYLESLI